MVRTLNILLRMLLLGTASILAYPTSRMGIRSRSSVVKLSASRLNYVHGYHAGNYADILKHSTLILLLQHMQRKQSPFMYVDTHAGAGSYPLDSEESMKMQEFKGGIGRLLDIQQPDSSEIPDIVSTLLSLVQKEDDASSSLSYPGSPEIARSFCRAQDSMLLFENQSDQFELLTTQQIIQGEALLEDGYKGLAKYAQSTSNLPRSLVFCDPPYQFGSDSDQAVALIRNLQRNWKSARFALWFPASEALEDKTRRLLSMTKEATDGVSEVLCFEMYLKSQSHVGTGMVLVNPPFGIENDLRSTLPQVSKLLDREKPTMRMKWL